MAGSLAPVLSFEECRRLFESVQRAAKSLGVSEVEALIAGHREDRQDSWRKRFASQMAPVLPTLQPWVERFGYEA